MLTESRTSVSVSQQELFLSGNGWQSGDFWNEPYHHDRLMAESLIENGADMSVVVRISEQGYKYNVLMEDPLMAKRYVSLIQRPESSLLIGALHGNVEQVISCANKPEARGILTDEDVRNLTGWSMARRVALRRNHLKESDKTYQMSHRELLAQWQTEIDSYTDQLIERGLNSTFEIGEEGYRDILLRVIADESGS